jgi:hypothetical protein
MSEHIPLHGIQSVVNSVGHVGTGVVVQQRDGISEFPGTFTLDLVTQLLKRCTVTVCSNL